MKTIGVIGAMDLEIQKIKSTMNVITTKNAAGMDFTLGTSEGNSIVLAMCGVGKVNAAVCTQIMIDLFAVDCIINVGVAGGLASGLEIGDIVISSDAMQHDMNAEGLDYPQGIIPDMETSLFKADECLIETARAALISCGLKGVIGRVASGDIFVCESSVKEYIVKHFEAACCEMEGAAIAQTCYLNKLPFVVIRAISDSADDSGSMDYPTFKAMAAENSGRIVHYMIKNIN
ncbi:MAG: 5'-methylthioadenosine/adenosylhomocysteine nucleosidase [Clostridiales bacterium]|nr:5'-methylthioadenosine/adenosylhomocysteine nucleosidase [Clostridiales bacterium]